MSVGDWYRYWLEEDDDWYWQESFRKACVCEQCGKEEPMCSMGERQLCEDCRLANDLCTLCARPALHGDWWCIEHDMDPYLTPPQEKIVDDLNDPNGGVCGWLWERS
jgi:hypothetical protein